MTVLEIEDRGGSTFVVRGQLDLDTAPAFRAAVLPSVTSGSDIELDFSELTFLDSSGLQALVSIAAEVAPGCVTVRGVHRGPLSVLSLTGLLDIRGLRVIPAEDDGS